MIDYRQKIKGLIEATAEYREIEKIASPNNWVVNKATDLLSSLEAIGIHPLDIDITVEEGICFSFRATPKDLHFEIYNTFEMGYIIEDFLVRRIVKNEDVNNVSEAVYEIRNFVKNYTVEEEKGSVYKGEGELESNTKMSNGVKECDIEILKAFGEYILQQYGINKEVKFCDILKFRSYE